MLSFLDAEILECSPQVRYTFLKGAKWSHIAASMLPVQQTQKLQFDYEGLDELFSTISFIL